MIGFIDNEDYVSVLKPDKEGTKLKRFQGNFCVLSCGDYHMAALDKEGFLWTCGRQEYGQLGHDSDEDVKNFTKVNDIVFGAVSCGGTFTAAIDQDGFLWMCGYSHNFRYQNPMIISEEKFEKVCSCYYRIFAIDKDNFIYVETSKGLEKQEHKFLDIKCGVYIEPYGSSRAWYLALDEDGFLWLSVDYGYETFEWEKICDKKFKTFSCGSESFLAIDEDGYLWGSGGNYFYQLGKNLDFEQERQNEDKDDFEMFLTTIRNSLYKVSDIKFRSVSCDEYTSIAIDQNDYLWVCGSIGKKHLWKKVNNSQKVKTLMNTYDDKRFCRTKGSHKITL